MYYVYIIKSLKDGGWYTGFSLDIENRLRQHNAGESISTRGRRPFILIYYEAYLHKMDAIGREKFLKSGSGKRFLEKQMRNYLQL